jgi:hypothetical protein
MRATAFAIAIAATVPLVAPAAEPKLDGSQIEKVTGLKGTYSEKENVFKVSSPRNDVKVHVDGSTLPPFMGLTSWAAFTPTPGGRAMVMGDIVVMQDEVNPAMSAALDSGLEVTALHNHFFYDEPKVYFMHIEGVGLPAKLASGVKAIFDEVREIRAKEPRPASQSGAKPLSEESTISAAALEDILGVKGQTSNGMFKAVWGRAARMHATKVGSEMGVNTWAAFAGSNDDALVDGDFAMDEGELQAVLRSMRKEGINIVAIHSHMTQERPRTLFLHYWARGRAQDLARALRHTLDAQRSAASGSTRHGG